MNVQTVKTSLGGGAVSWRAFSVSFANQVISSGTNLLLTLVFVRLMEATDFGLYGVAIAAILLCSGVANAVILTQMVVHFPDKQDAEKPAFLGRVLLLVGGLCVAFAVTGTAMSAVVPLVPPLAGLAPIVLATAGAVVAYIAKDFFLRVAYSLRREKVALQIVIAIAAGTLLAVAIELVTAKRLDAVAGIKIYGAGQLAGALVGAIACRRHIRIEQSSRLGDDLAEFFGGGRWALGGVLTTWLQTQAYVYLTAVFVGPAGVAYANAGRVFVAPLQLMLPAVNQVTMPRLASLRSEGGEGLASAGGHITRSLILVALLYMVVLGAVFPFASGIVLGGKYNGVGFAVAVWAVLMLAQIARDGASTVLQVMRNFRRLTVSATAVACLTLPIAAVLAKGVGALGPMLATAAGEVMLALVLWRSVGRERA